MRTKPFKYQPDELLQKFKDYINYCIEEERLANIEGFCVYADMNKTTYYRYRDREQYKEAMEMIDLIHEDETIQKLVRAKNPVGVIVYAKNKLGYVDKKEIQTHTNTNVLVTSASKEELVADILKMLPKDVVDVECKVVEEE
jgi:hypothetical protein